jgi:tricorn protease
MKFILKRLILTKNKSNHIMNKLLLTFIVLTTFITLSISQDTINRLFRFPTIYNDQITFSYAGNLYSVSSDGGIARKLTSHNGYEMFAKYSPDGQQIAFTGQYDGNTEIFIMPSDGGIPKRLTYTATLKRDDISDRMGPNNILMAWTPNGESLIYRSRKQSFNDFKGQLFKVSKSGGLSEELPLPAGGFCSYSPDGKKLAYNRVFREFRTWKYYKGGMADDIWIYDFETKKTINITNNDAQDIIPMWHGEEIYFISDRDRTMNLFVYNTKTTEITKISDFNNYDIKFPSIGGDKIVYENGGFIYIYDITAKSTKKVNITIADDFLGGRNEMIDASDFIHGSDVSPEGSRIIFSARGEIFSVPSKNGITRNLTKSSGAHDRNPVWSPDGKYIAYVSDATGEYEIYIQKQDGSEKAIQLTKNADTYKYHIKWSPDSKKLLWGDKKLRLQYIDIDTKNITQVYQSETWEIRQFDWSPDSKWIAFTDHNKMEQNKIKLYSLEDKSVTDLTDSWYSASQPSFSKDGKYLFFVSERTFNPIYSSTEWNHAYSEMSKIYFITLAKETPSPFAPENDEVDLSKNEKNEDEKEDKDNDATNLTVDLDGIKDRIIELPLSSGNYWSITSLKNKVYYYRHNKNKGANLYMYDLKKKKEIEIGKIDSYKVSYNKKKMLVKNDKNYYVIDLPKDKIKLEEPTDLSNMSVMINKKKEWKQIYDESWRQMRDFFYDPEMHGVDWNQMKTKYGDLIPYVNDRNDLNYLIGELIGELNCGHAYVNGGDKVKPERIQTGLLGAKIVKDGSGYYKINKILKGANWSKELRSPLTEIGINVSEGDYITAIDGISVKEFSDIYIPLVGKANKQVMISVNSKPSEEGSKTYIIKPIDDESALYYYNWVQNNIEKVNKATNGKVGYIHIPDMGPDGLNEFVKHFYPQLSKKALIIDDRGNGGGNVSPMIIERLRRDLSLMGMSRNVPEGDPKPRQLHYGPKVLLLDNYSASDGDLFPYQFKKHKLGKTIGVRSWGGVVGIRGSLPFIDGGQLRKPEFAHYAADGSKFIIEGYGVEPDIVIDNDPAKEYEGIDEQLNKAIEVALEEIENWNKSLPEVPPFPDKSK